MFRRSVPYLFAALAALVALAGLASSTLLALAEPVFPPGLRIGLDPPGDVKLSTRFPGFEDSERKVIIAILDLPASAYPELETALFRRTKDDLQELKRESFPFGSGIGFLVSGVTEQNNVRTHRWSLLAMAIGQSVPNLTMLINVEVPEDALSVYSEAVIRKALSSVTFRPMPIEEQLGLLPFKLGDLSGFQVMQVSPTGSVILADGQTNNNERQPFMIISIERGGPAESADRGLFARNLLATAPVRDLTMQSADAMRIGGAPGHEIRAIGKGPAGEPVSLVQWLRFGGGAFLRMIGVSPTEKWDQSFGRFRTVRDGITAR
jgi:hypothetical protein